jgi:hypothetical protein
VLDQCPPASRSLIRPSEGAPSFRAPCGLPGLERVFFHLYLHRRVGISASDHVLMTTRSTLGGGEAHQPLLPRRCSYLSENTTVTAAHLPEVSFGAACRLLRLRNFAASYIVEREEASDEGDDEKHQRDIQSHGPPERQTPLGSS